MTASTVHWTENRLRFSIAGLMHFVLVGAIDFALFQHCFMNYVILPLVTLLLLGLPRLRRGQRARPFWGGFEVIGWPMLGLSYLLYQCYLRFDALDVLVYPAGWLERSGFLARYGWPAGYACAIAIYGGPQLLAATFAGWLSARYRVVRRWPVDRGLLEEMIR